MAPAWRTRPGVPRIGRSDPMKITDVRTTLVIVPRDPPISDATALQMTAGGYCFVHIRTDEGISVFDKK